MMLISVITPTYNRASFLAETIESVLSQSYKNFEYIVVDDGSTDNTSQVLARYPSLTVITQANSGEAAAVNAGISAARGDLVVIVNSDDPLRPDAFSTAVEALAACPDAVFGYPDWDEIDEHGKTTRTINLETGLTFEKLLTSFSNSLGPALCFRRSALNEAGLRRVDRKFTSDLDLLMRVAALGPILHIPHVLGTHRVHKSAASSTSQGWRMAWELVQLSKDSIRQNSHILRDNRRIMSISHYVAHRHCGTNYFARAYHCVLCVLWHPTRVLAFVSKRIKLAFSDASISSRVR
jgi:glycosyltransferase involved in cell wall biosynthesis